MDSLLPYRWKYRIIAYSLSDSDTAKFEQARQQARPAAKERDIRYIALTPTQKPESQDHLDLPLKSLDKLRAELRVTTDQTRLILIGKDGGVKARIQEIDLQRLFNQIDQMPMRRAEMAE